MMFARAATLLALYGLAALLVFACFHFLPWDLRRSSALWGYALFSDYDVRLMVVRKHALLLLPPVLAWLAYLPLARRLGWKPRVFVTSPLAARVPSPFREVLPLLCVGFGLGWFDYVPGETTLAALGFRGALAYTAVVAGFAWLLVLWRRWEFSRLRATVNVVAASLLLLVPALWSSRSQVCVEGSCQALSWMPWGVAILPALGLGVWAARRACKQSAAQWESAYLSALLFPFYFATAVLWIPERPNLAANDLFHTGEYFIPAVRWLRGEFPWRDFLFVHGFYQDVLAYAVGMARWGQTFWAAETGIALWLLPLSLASCALFYVGLFGRDRWAVFGTLAALLLGVPWAATFSQRFGAVPLVLLACLLYLRKPSPLRALGFAVLTVVVLFGTPETVFLDLGLAAAVFVADLQEGRKRFPRTLWFGGFSLSAIGLAFLWLGTRGALSPFLELYLATAQDYPLGVGVPPEHPPATHSLLLLLVAAAFWFGASRWRARRKLTAEELTLGAVALFAVFYYRKYTSRADSRHLREVLGIAQPLFFYTLQRGLWIADSALARKCKARWPWVTRPATAVATAFLLHWGWGSAQELWGENSKKRFVREMDVDSLEPRLGYVREGPELRALHSELRAFFDKAGNTEPVMDFTNQPFLYFHILDLAPAMRAPGILIAMHPKLQRGVLADLERNKPRFAVLEARKGKVTEWDGVTNYVRHAQVSRAILRDYQPVAWIQDELLLERREGARWKPLPRARAFDGTRACDWGWIPAYDARRESVSGASLPLSSLPGAREAAGKAAALELVLGKTPEQELALVTSAGKEVTKFRVRAGEGVRYRVPIGSCPHWYGEVAGLGLVAQKPLELRKVEWKD